MTYFDSSNIQRFTKRESTWKYKRLEKIREEFGGKIEYKFFTEDEWKFCKAMYARLSHRLFIDEAEFKMLDGYLINAGMRQKSNERIEKPATRYPCVDCNNMHIQGNKTIDKDCNHCEGTGEVVIISERLWKKVEKLLKKDTK